MNSPDIWEFAELTKRRAYFEPMVYLKVPSTAKDVEVVKALHSGKYGTDSHDTFLVQPHEWLEGIDWRCVMGRLVIVCVGKGRESIGRQLEALIPRGDPAKAIVWYESTDKVVELEARKDDF